MGLAHYGESLAAHSFFRVQLPTKKQDSRPSPSYTQIFYGVSLMIPCLADKAVLSLALYRGYRSCLKRQRSLQLPLFFSVSFSFGSIGQVAYLFCYFFLFLFLSVVSAKWRICSSCGVCRLDKCPS